MRNHGRVMFLCSYLLVAFLVFFIFLAGRNVVVDLSDSPKIIGIVLITFLVMALADFLHQTAQEDPLLNRRSFFFRHSTVLLVLALHLLTIITHWFSMQITGISYWPEVLFGINVGLFVIRLVGMRMKNHFWVRTLFDSTVFLVFSISLYLILMPF